MIESLKAFIVYTDQCVRDCIIKLGSVKSRTLFVINSNNVMQGTVTDSDIRNAILKGISLEDNITEVMNKNFVSVSSLDMPLMYHRDRNILLDKYNVSAIPILNDKNILISVIVKESSIYSSCPVVVMCGGLGSRMGNYTKTCPKPMLPINGKPMLEHILIKLRNANFKKFYFAINYLGNIIEDYFQDGKNFGVEIIYLKEKKRLGTGGALSLIQDNIKNPIIVMNGDIITDFNFRNFLDFHLNCNAFATMAVSEYCIQNPFGVVELDGNSYISMIEKPVYRSYINAGIYAIHPDFLQIVPKDDFIDMPTLLDRAKSLGKDIKVYPIVEGWHDIGRVSDYLNINREGVS